MKGKSLTNIFKGDKVIWMIFFFLCMISIIEVYSASSSLTLKKGYYWAPIMDHAKKIILGVVALVCVLNVECKYFKMATPFALGGSIIMILWVLVGGETINGANRWLTFFGIQFQPSELAKGALVLATAQILSAMQTDKGADRKAFRYILLLSAWIIIPIAMENGSTAFLLAITIFVMMFVGRVPLDQLGKLFGVMAVIATIALSVIMIYGKTEQERAKDPRHQLTEQMAKAKTKQPKTLADRFEDRLDTWKSRIVKFTNPEDVPANKVNLRDKDSQKNYSHIAIASSGIVGKGPGNSTARDGLAQAFSDFIYAIIIEELGIIGAAFVALLFSVVNNAIEGLVEFRTQEGNRLATFFEDKIHCIQELLNEVPQYENERVTKIKSRIQESLEKLGDVDYDKNRFEQEMIFYIEKLDITEEKLRLQNHLDYFISTLNGNHGQGKKLGFISQEMGREINTMGSKANQAELQKVVVRMKDQLEQIKEQVLNVM